MPRCNECASCFEVIGWRAENKGRKNEKKRKKLEKSNPCSNPTSGGKKMRVSEVDSLYAAGHGGQIRGEFKSAPKQPAVREARSKSNLDESLSFDSEAFDEYVQLVVRCSNRAKASKSADVRLEFTTMIPKMQKLTNLQVKEEVDYVEANRDVSNILTRWMNGDAAGTRAFIPDLKHRDDCYAALKIFSCAEEESKKIRLEYLSLFGRDEGVDIYNKLLDVIGEQDKGCLPLVNRCLRVYIDKLTEDMDLWDDLSPLSFDKWKADELQKERKNRPGKTSYELMMSVFGNESSTNEEAETAAFEKSAIESGMCLDPFPIE